MREESGITGAKKSQVAKILGFEDAWMLALFFGSDGLRTPSQETWNYLCRYLKSLPENRARIFLECDYLKIMSDCATPSQGAKTRTRRESVGLKSILQRNVVRRALSYRVIARSLF